MKRHIIINGDIHIGKSTLIKRLIQEIDVPVYGFITKRLESDETGFHPIYIHPASQAIENRVYEDRNRIGTCNSKIHNINIDVFNTEGVRLLNESKSDGIIIMDELGFMESKAEKFVNAVFEALDGDIPVIAAVKSRTDVPFLEQIRNHPNVDVYWITKENRDELFNKLLSIIK